MYKENFIVGKANEQAYKLANEFTEGILFIYGNIGSGKTHLAKVVEEDLKKQNLSVKMVNSDEFVSELIWSIRRNRDSVEAFLQEYEDFDVLILEDIHFLDGKITTQECFAETLKRLIQKNKRVLLTSVKNVEAYPWLYECLHDCMNHLQQVSIQDADMELKRNIWDKLQKEWSYKISPENTNLIVENARNIRELEGMFKKMMAYVQIWGVEKL